MLLGKTIEQRKSTYLVHGQDLKRLELYTYVSKAFLSSMLVS